MSYWQSSNSISPNSGGPSLLLHTSSPACKEQRPWRNAIHRHLSGDVSRPLFQAGNASLLHGLKRRETWSNLGMTAWSPTSTPEGLLDSRDCANSFTAATSMPCTADDIITCALLGHRNQAPAEWLQMSEVGMQTGQKTSMLPTIYLATVIRDAESRWEVHDESTALNGTAGMQAVEQFHCLHRSHYLHPSKLPQTSM